MTHLDALINVYDEEGQMGVAVPATYVLDAQRFFQDHGVHLSEPEDVVPPRLDPLSEQPVVRMATIGGVDPLEDRLQNLHNLAGKFREYMQREA